MSNSTTADDNTYVLYRYSPSIAVAGVASGLVAIATGLHCWQMWKSRAWFLTPLLIGGLYWTIGPYVIQSVLPLVAPALFAGSIYMILGRIILIIDGESHSIIRRKWLTKMFVCGDVLAFMIQAGGSGFMSGGSPSSMKTGEKIVVGGLFVQILFFGLFVVVALAFHYRMRKVPTVRVCSEPVPWERHLHALYVSSALIMVRSIFRVIEFLTGNTGYIFSHEWFMWLFDALLMMFVLILFVYIHPGEIRRYLDGAKGLACGIFR
ncbi:RTA1-domain-containing protein [Hyaloscypha variabilis F]|uniref:RTA1-domain-containing protein n=1 Tax=Hyaloscypha variabilis (strain UAMH 11265 / GT02V1 / F) TaxID=1149755 RepID=A0A2J6QR99_HYAVF|nr:RTA1-domain-containing protein [Hyaloscypha variabilis F]PMD30504.1 RTA1-domain-containing protein [Hyaloscypha variabilis F]